MSVSLNEVTDILAGLEMDPETVFASKDPNALQVSGKKNPDVILEETLEHRLVVISWLQGVSLDEIAQVTGYSKTHIQRILKQPFARQLQARTAIDIQTSAATRLRSEVLRSIDTACLLRDDKETPAAVRLGAVKLLLDRAMGTARVLVVDENNVPLDMKDLEQKLRAARERTDKIYFRPSAIAEVEDPHFRVIEVESIKQ